MCRLQKALYGLKQTPRASYSRIDTYLQDLCFEKSEANPNLYYLVDGEDPIILVLYVNDLFIIGAERLIGRCMVDLATEFKMNDIDMMHYFLGMEVWQEDGSVFLEQGKYAHNILHRLQKLDCRSMTTPMTTNF